MELIFVIVLGVHGFIHLYGFASEQFLVDIKELTWKKIVTVHPRLNKIIGVFWAIAWIFFWLSAIGIMFGENWWKIAALAGVTISQILVILYLKYAWFGTIGNALIIAAIIWFF